ncbi:MAG: hypothetical protein Q8880_11825 [Bacteroidota bacterium]|nr:hypothetical protein [Bacteroidota bacterium]
MALNKGKHTVSEIDGVRCTVVESGIDESRVSFLKNLLEFNKFEVRIEKEKKKQEEDSTKFTLGVTDVAFNPVIAVYERVLRTQDGHRVTPAYWNQWTTICNPNYWKLKRNKES